LVIHFWKLWPYRKSASHIGNFHGFSLHCQKRYWGYKGLRQREYLG